MGHILRTHPRPILFSDIASRHHLPSLRFTQTLVDFLCKDAQHLPFNLIVAEQKRKEILILIQAFNQRIIDVIKVRELEVFYCIVLCTGFQLVRFQEDVPNPQHSFYDHIVVICFSGSAVDLCNDLGEPFLLRFGQAKALCGWQLYHRLCYQIRSGAFFGFLMHEVSRFDFAVEVIPATRMLDVNVSQQISDEVVFLVQIRILKAGYLQKELIEADGRIMAIISCCLMSSYCSIVFLARLK